MTFIYSNLNLYQLIIASALYESSNTNESQRMHNRTQHDKSKEIPKYFVRLGVERYVHQNFSSIP